MYYNPETKEYVRTEFERKQEERKLKEIRREWTKTPEQIKKEYDEWVEKQQQKDTLRHNWKWSYLLNKG